MKTLLSTMLLTIAVFLHFNRINSTDDRGSSSGTSGQHGGSRRGAGRPRGRQSKRQDGAVKGAFRNKPYFRNPVVVSGPPWGIVEHRGQDIEVWLDESRRRIIKADYPGNDCPSGADYGTKNFLVRLATLKGGLKIVEYVTQDARLLGVRAPRPTTANVMEPYTTQWFIVYFGFKFRVRINPSNSQVQSITLASENEHEVVQGERTQLVDMAGLQFYVMKGGPKDEITGGEPVTKSVLHLL